TKALYDVIGFKPETSVKEGVKNFVEWYRNFYKV
ncbi:nucleotide sugar epimerase, partial [Escherichia coli]